MSSLGGVCPISRIAHCIILWNNWQIGQKCERNQLTAGLISSPSSGISSAYGMLPLALCNGLEASTDWVLPLKAFLKDVSKLELLPLEFNWLLDIVGLTEVFTPKEKTSKNVKEKN